MEFATLVEATVNHDEPAFFLREGTTSTHKLFARNGRRPLWGCLWFKRWRDNVELAVSRGQRLVAYFFEEQVGEGLITWPELCKKETNLWDGKGLGASQKAELAFLQKMGYDFEQRDVSCCRLSEILGDQIEGVDIFLKVDVEGAEVQLLQGLDEKHWDPWPFLTLQKRRDAIFGIAMEVSGVSLTPILQLCKDHSLEVEYFKQPSSEAQDLEDHLLLPSPYHPADARSLPTGLKLIIGFGLCALKCCGEDRFKDSQELQRWQQLSKVLGPEDLALEATELVFTMKVVLEKWPEEQDNEFFSNFTRILSELAEETDEFQSLWDDVRSRKQAIADCAGNCDEQLMTLAQRTHFSVEEIERLRKEVSDMRRNPRQPAKVDLDSFKELVKRAVPEFPTDLCGRLFQKLDCFRVGRLSFVELACGMSALSLGTMDEKLQVCFDMFDSEGRRALSLSDVNDLCSTLFRVALSSGMGHKQASTDEVVNALSKRSFRLEESGDSPIAATFAGERSSSFNAVTPPPRRLEINADGSPRVMERSSMPLRRQVPKNRSNEDPSRSMLLRLLAAAKVRTPGGPWLVAFEDFCNAARMEPALLCLFSWCLPRPPQSTPVFMSRSQWATPDLNREIQIPVDNAGSQPRAPDPDPSGQYRTSSSGSQWATPDLNREEASSIRQVAAAKQKQASSRRQAAGKQPQASSRQTADGKQQTASSSRQAAAGKQQQASSKMQAISGKQYQVSNSSTREATACKAAGKQQEASSSKETTGGKQQ
eukprot:s2105_g4.t1